MAEYDFVQVDAFTDRPLEGNACAVVFDADDLDEAAMQSVAREMNLSETAFVLGSEVADVRARYFTPAEEVPLAGHPTIATIHALVERGRFPLAGERTEIRLELQVGVIPVEIAARDGRVTRITMSQKRPEFLRTYDPEIVLPLVGLPLEARVPGAPAQTVSTGTPQLMVAVRDRATLAGAGLDLRAWGRFKRDGDFFSVHLFCLEGASAEGDTFARHFAGPPDHFEDPFTGSATGGMAAYLWRYGLLDEPRFVAEQGHGMGRPGRAWVEVVGPREAIETVRVGGRAVTVIHGTLEL